MSVRIIPKARSKHRKGDCMNNIFALLLFNFGILLIIIGIKYTKTLEPNVLTTLGTIILTFAIKI